VDDLPRIDSASVPIRSLHVRARNIAGDIVLAGPHSDESVTLSETAGFLWRSMDGRRSVHDLGVLLTEHYAVDVETAVLDVTDMVAELAGLRFVTVAAARDR
jgi:hypothetical protein